MTDMLELRDVSVFYGQRAALDSVSLSIAHGAQVAVVGPNGAGKSTLFKAMVGLITPRSGEMLIHGRPPAEYRDPIAYVPQREEVDWRFPVTVFDVVAMGRYGRGRWLKRLTPVDREVVQRSLERLGIDPLAQRPIGELSGGQQQRAFLARAWPRSRMCFCWMSPSPAWTWRPGRRPSTCWRRSALGRSRCWSRPTISIWRRRGSIRWFC